MSRRTNPNTAQINGAAPGTFDPPETWSGPNQASKRAFNPAPDTREAAITGACLATVITGATPAEATRTVDGSADVALPRTGFTPEDALLAVDDTDRPKLATAPAEPTPY